MDLREVDLNLLVVLDALLQEAHVSRAARRLKLSQPATSSALERCRRLFGDPLLLRAAGGMQLTPRAQRLREELQELLVDVRAVLDVENHPLGEARQTLRVSMSDSLLVRVAEPLIRYLAETAPGVDLVFTAWFGPGRALDGLASGDVDIAVSQFPQAGASIDTRVVGRDEYEVVMRKKHPAAASFDLDQWVAWPHLLVSGRGENYSSVDRVLQAHGKSRRVAVVVPHFLLVPPLLVGTDLIATLPRGTVTDSVRRELVVFPPPVRIEGYELHIAWHRRLKRDPVTRHVADFLTGQFATG